MHNGVFDIDIILNDNLKKSLLYEYNKRMVESKDFLNHHIVIASVCYNTKFLNGYVPDANLRRRFELGRVLRAIGIHIGRMSSVTHSDKLMYNSMMKHSRKLYRKNMGMGISYDTYND